MESSSDDGLTSGLVISLEGFEARVADVFWTTVEESFTGEAG